MSFTCTIRRLGTKLRWEGGSGHRATDGKKAYLRLDRKGKQDVREKFHARQREQDLQRHVVRNHHRSQRDILGTRRELEDAAFHSILPRGRSTAAQTKSSKAESLAMAREFLSMSEALRKSQRRRRQEWRRDFDDLRQQ